MPILALECTSTSYQFDFGRSARGTSNAFMQNIDWANAVQLHEASRR